MLQEFKLSSGKIAFTVTGIFICLWIANSQTDVIGILRKVTLWDAAQLCFLTVGILIIISLQFRVLIRVFGVTMKFKEWFGLTAVNTMANYIFPAKTGSVIRGVYLKKNYSFPLSYYASLIASSQLISVLITTGAGLLYISIFTDLFKLKIDTLVKIIVLLAVISFVTYLLLSVLTNKSLLSKKIKTFISMMRDGFVLLGQSKVTIIVYSLLALAGLLLWAVRLQFCFSSLDTEVEFSKVLLIQILVNISFLVSLTPGNIGIKEGVTAYSASQLGIDPSVAIVASLIDRTFAMIVVFIFGAIFSKILFLRFNNS